LWSAKNEHRVIGGWVLLVNGHASGWNAQLIRQCHQNVSNQNMMRVARLAKARDTERSVASMLLKSVCVPVIIDFRGISPFVFLSPIASQYGRSAGALVTFSVNAGLSASSELL
jgi:hypothetical protein